MILFSDVCANIAKKVKRANKSARFLPLWAAGRTSVGDGVGSEEAWLLIEEALLSQGEDKVGGLEGSVIRGDSGSCAGFLFVFFKPLPVFNDVFIVLERPVY